MPESLIVVGENGKERPLLSYKSPNELLVVVFFSVACPTGQTLWPELRRLHEHFKDWRVAFVAVSTSPPEVLATTLRKEKIPWPTVIDNQKSVAHALHISGTPELLIIDEFSLLRYRGPVSKARKSLDTFIAQISPVQDPEPPLGESCPY